MKTKANDSAFPRSGDTYSSPKEGLTKLEYFSALIVAERSKNITSPNETFIIREVEIAVDIAEALIRELQECE